MPRLADVLAEQQKTASGTEAAKAPEYAIERAADGKVYVQINADILQGKPQSEWKTIIRQALQDLFQNGINLKRGTIFSNRKGRGEFTNGSYTKMLERTAPDIYQDKLRMTPGISGLLETAENIRYEDASHTRSDDIVGFNRGDIVVSVKDRGYTGDILTAIYSDGKETFFDLNNLAIQKAEAASPERCAAQDGFTQTGDATSIHSISPAGGNVNGASFGVAPIKNNSGPEPIKTGVSAQGGVSGVQGTLSNENIAQGPAAVNAMPDGSGQETPGESMNQPEQVPVGPQRGSGAMDTLKIHIEGDMGDYSATASLRGQEQGRRDTQRAVREAEQRLDPTKAEKLFAKGIAVGDYMAEDIPASMSRATVLELVDYYVADASYNGPSGIKERKTDIREQTEDLARQHFEDADAYKPISMLVMNERTPERVMRSIFGDAKGEEVNQAYIYPVQRNEAEKIRFTNRMLDTVREFNLSREERTLAQRLARWMVTQDALNSGNVDGVKINNAVEKYAAQYDLFYDAVNDFLTVHGYAPIGFIKGYAPHMQEMDKQTRLSSALRALGVNLNR